MRRACSSETVGLFAVATQRFRIGRFATRLSPRMRSLQIPLVSAAAREADFRLPCRLSKTIALDPASRDDVIFFLHSSSFVPEPPVIGTAPQPGSRAACAR